MSTGLRERKKLRLRQAIQREALRLFTELSYDNTTVEQITEAAETSTTTFYRYFPTKEDVVLADDFDPQIDAAIAARPAGEPILDTVRAITATIAQVVTQEKEQSVARLRLIDSVPALVARQAVDERARFDLFARILAERSQRPLSDFQLRLATAALTAAQAEAARWWAERDGEPSLPELMDAAALAVAPLVNGLTAPGHDTPAEAH
jgi:AcrR family transcriptional regulator